MAQVCALWQRSENIIVFFEIFSARDPIIIWKELKVNKKVIFFALYNFNICKIDITYIYSYIER